MLEPHLPFITPRVLELVYTAYDMTPLARDLGDEGEPFRWDEDRRAQLRAELDAFFFRLYGIDDRDDVDYILETFQTETGGLKHNEIRDHGEYRTKRLVLAEYDRMAAADAQAFRMSPRSRCRQVRVRVTRRGTCSARHDGGGGQLQSTISSTGSSIRLTSGSSSRAALSFH